MRFTVAVSLLAALTNATPLADTETSAPLTDSDSWGPELLKRTWFDCKGSAKCSTGADFLRDCDRVVDSDLIRTDAANYGARWSGLPDGAERKHCKIFVAGPATCRRSGNGLWKDYQDIRKHGCKDCGTKHWGDGDKCRTTVNYVG